MSTVSERELVLDGVCPICGKDGFVVPLDHIAQAHKVNGPDARRLFGLSRWETASSPAYHERRSQLAKANGFKTGEGGAVRRREYTCAWCSAVFEARTYKDADRIDRYCSNACVLRARAARRT